MIDLSFLTDEEQEAILTVLRRDAELKKTEEQRVLNLQKSVADKSQLKYLSGEWFYETKQLRHQDRIHGSDIIRAAMKHTLKPLTIMEIAHILPERSSFMSSENKEVFVPPELRGLLQEPNVQLRDGCQIFSPHETVQETPKADVRSPTKQRKNPFNSELVCEEKDGQSLVRAADQAQRQNERTASSPDSSTTAKQNANKNILSQDASVPGPVPGNRDVSISSQDVFAEVDGSHVRQTISADLPAIIKNKLASSSTRSLLFDLVSQSPTETWMARKQENFSLASWISVEQQDGKQLREQRKPSATDLESISSASDDTQTPFIQQSRVDSKEELTCKTEANFQDHEAGRLQVTDVKRSGKPDELKTEYEEDFHSHAKAKNQPSRPSIYSSEANSYVKPSPNCSSKSSSHAPPPNYKQKLLGFLKREKDRDSQVMSLQKKEQKISKQEGSRFAPDLSVDTPATTKQDTKSAQIKEVKSVQLTVLQNTPFKEMLSSLEADGQQEGLVSQETQLSKTSTREELQHEDTAKKEKETYRALQTKSDVTEEDSADKSQQNNFSQQPGYKMFVDLSKEDGTYRANPVLIYDETDESLAGSVTDLHNSELHEESIICFVLPESLNTQKQEQHNPVSVLRDSTFTSQRDGLAEAKKWTLPKVDTASHQEVSIQSNRRISSDNNEKSFAETLINQHKTKPLTLKSPKTTTKVTVHPNRSDSRSVGCSIDAQSPYHHDLIKIDTNSQERSLSPSKSPKSKDKDDKVRWSPSKTYHPKVLPRESSSTSSSKLEGSPLKTFPIEINPKTKVSEEQQEDLTPSSRQKKSPSHAAKPAVLTETNTSPTRPPAGTCSPQSKHHPHLHRSLIPQDHQHYLGPQEKAHKPPFYQDKAAVGESDAVHRPQRTIRNQSKSPSERSPQELTSLNVQNNEENSRQETTRAWSLPRPNSDTSTITNLKPMKPSLSVPLLQQNETDSTFETNLGHKRNNSSSMSNMTLSSGMASMSSISSSVSSLHPPDCGDVDIQGSIQFAVNYIQKLGEFHIFVVLVRGLAVADTKKNRSDPYVKCYLLPDKTKLGKRKTTVKKRTLNPTYNEVLRFKIKLEELKTQKLNISVWHNDTFGRNSFLGEVDLDLFQWDFSNTQINEYTLKARVSEPASAPAPSHIVEERGQMRVALRFLLQTPNSKGASRMETGEVQIWVKDCKNLPPVGGIIINPFVKCTVLPDMSFKSRQKTRVVKRTASPMFNHIMVYDGFRSEDLKEACVEITVWDHDRLKNQYVGGLRLGLGTGKSYGVDVFWMDSTRNETDLWQRMLQSDGEWVEDVLPLRMIVTAKSMSK
ncbi:synaptotagmin-like protein 2 isoform X3 [Melanotaenia boesemani]|uniref:synaptotagmin-like protein 2 isoform X3 n=1 Tax=Melanotaenia boesemani TaxID=1250792 RepID=UPI001C044499|nr:synaptotagmin-like protein 2 isoform X3 [Melanotaenia boesemani]